MSSDSLIIPDKNTCDSSMVIRSWSEHSDSSILSDQKIFIPATFSQQFASHIHSDDEKSLLQLDYKTRNKYKTKQRRQDPFYRSQERVRQRTVMRLKRQDPGFREAEREKGRYRMRLKRLDPKFRSQERERQRERMKAKRRDPEFREREREQQKTRLHVKRLDPAFKEKERAQDRLRMRLKRQNNSLFANLHADDIKVSHESDLSVTSDKMLKDMCKSEDSREEFQNQTVFPENFSAKLLSLKSQESVIETFHFKKQQILNFNFYNTNKEQWLQEMCSRAVAQTSDISESDTLQSASVAEVNSDMMQKLPLIKKKDLKDESSSESLEKIKSSELSLSDLQKYTNSSHITVSTDKYSSTNTEN
nr:RNA-binding protein 25 isoform X2 [Parasteatoda tepidariorum]